MHNRSIGAGNVTRVTRIKIRLLTETNTLLDEY